MSILQRCILVVVFASLAACAPQPTAPAESAPIDPPPAEQSATPQTLERPEAVAKHDTGRVRAEQELRQLHDAAVAGKAVQHYSSAVVAGERVAPSLVPPPVAPGFNREGYDHIAENGFRDPRLSPLSTFGLDVDTTSYSNVRRFLSQGRLPPADAVRIEELVNYFDYSYPAPGQGEVLSVSTELSQAPWNPAHQLALIGVRAQAPTTRQPNRLVFLIDTSGSMNAADKLPLLKRSFQILVESLRPEDSVAIVTYAGSAGLVLPITSGVHKESIYAALNQLHAGGSTAGARGIELAYQVAQQQFLAEANNRVILATDGDFNVGQSSQGELVRLIEARRDQGVFLTVLGFGSGNYQDGRMQALADHGNGAHYYIDTDREADRIFRDKLSGTLYTVAKDVKLQIEWNPSRVARYRLIGYENRMLNPEDFVDDKKDAGELGAGHQVTALYELVPADGAESAPPLRYQSREAATRPAAELGLVKWRYKAPLASQSSERRVVIRDQARDIAQSSPNLRWAASVAELGLLLRASEHRGQASFDALIARAEPLTGQGADAALRREFIGLSRQAKLASQPQLGMAPAR